VKQTIKLIVLDGGSSQIIRYCKNHFGPTDKRNRVEDMRKLVANRNNGITEWINDYDMMLSLLAVLREVEKLPIESHTMSYFMSVILFGGQYGRPILSEKYKGAFPHFVDAVYDILASLQIRQPIPDTNELQDLIVLAPLDEELGKALGFDPAIGATCKVNDRRLKATVSAAGIL
jgi:hypothetical protein